jgi:hypothetical protein
MTDADIIDSYAECVREAERKKLFVNIVKGEFRAYRVDFNGVGAKTLVAASRRVMVFRRLLRGYRVPRDIKPHTAKVVALEDGRPYDAGRYA